MKKLAVLLMLLLVLMSQVAFAIQPTVYVEDEDAIRSAFAYKLDGVDYAFPTPVSELTANGWEAISVVNELDAMTYAKAHFENYVLQKNGALIEVSYLNATDAAKPIEDCTVGELRIKPDRVGDPDEKRAAATKLFSLANGTKVGNTFQEVLDNFGLTLRVLEAGEQDSFEDYYDGSSCTFSADEGQKYILLKDGKYYHWGDVDKMDDELTFYFKIKEEGYSLHIPSLSSQEVGDNWLTLQFDRPLNEAGATLTAIWMQLWM